MAPSALSALYFFLLGSFALAREVLTRDDSLTVNQSINQSIPDFCRDSLEVKKGDLLLVHEQSGQGGGSHQ